jgi:hypothetical protein
MKIELTYAEKCFMEGYILKGDKILSIPEWYLSIVEEQGEGVANSALCLLIDSYKDSMRKVYEN